MAQISAGGAQVEAWWAEPPGPPFTLITGHTKHSAVRNVSTPEL